MARRYLVTIAREVIVYADTAAEARRKAVGVDGVRIVNGVMQRNKATGCKRLPPIEKEAHGPAIDVAPARETR
jgi:hypothetical protein